MLITPSGDALIILPVTNIHTSLQVILHAWYIESDCVVRSMPLCTTLVTRATRDYVRFFTESFTMNIVLIVFLSLVLIILLQFDQKAARQIHINQSAPGPFPY